jgi:hypothetical protein
MVFSVLENLRDVPALGNQGTGDIGTRGKEKSWRQIYVAACSRNPYQK